MLTDVRKIELEESRDVDGERLREKFRRPGSNYFAISFGVR